MHSASRSDIQGARRLRTEMTDAEVRLGIRLRRRQIDGYRFRRQVTMGPYVVDFACLKARLVVEVDGDPLPIPPRRGEGRPLNEMIDARSGWNRGLQSAEVLELRRSAADGGSTGKHPCGVAGTPSLSLPARGRETQDLTCLSYSGTGQSKPADAARHWQIILFGLQGPGVSRAPEAFAEG